jgi:hypothetical protein
MVKRQANDPKATRKRKKGNTSYKFFSHDSSDDEKVVVEDSHVWDVSTSDKTGRITAKKRISKHYSNVLLPEEPSTSQKQGRIEEATNVEDVGILADSEGPHETTDKKLRRKRKRVRVVKENDSVGEPLVSPPP